MSDSEALTPDAQRLLAARERVAYRLKQLRMLAALYQAPSGPPPVESPGSAMAVSFALKELEVLASLLGLETGADG